MAYNIGNIIRLTYAVKNDLQVLANPATATLTITQPDGTTVTPAVTLPPPTTGLLVVDFTAAQAGLHSVRWTTTAPSTAEDDTFTVEAPASMLVSVDEAIAHLRATQTINSDADREQVQWLCLVATDAIERDLDRILVRRTVTGEVHNGSQHAIILRHTPVISVTSVTESGVLVDPSGYLLDSATGFLYRGTTSYANRFAWGYQNVSVTYVAGYANPPRVARLAALNLVQSMWQSSQTAAHPVYDESSAEAFATAALPGLGQIPGYNSLRSMAVA
jgi:hypothetical protein